MNAKDGGGRDTSRASRWSHGRRIALAVGVLIPAGLLAMRRGVAAPVAASAGIAAIAHPAGGVVLAREEAPLTQAPAGSGSIDAFLGAVRGANPVLCDLAARSIDGRWGWSNGYGNVPAGSRDARTQEILRTVTSELQDPSVVPALRTALSDADPCVRRMAAPLLGRMNAPQAFAALQSALRAEDAATREMAALGLGFADDARAVPGLVEALRDAVPAVRAMSAWALGATEDPAAVAPLVAVLRGDADPAVRRAAAWALGQIE